MIRRPLRTIRLANFKAFSTLRMEVRPFTLLTGTNSSGKSTLMQAIALLEQSRTQGVQGLMLNGPLVELGEYVDVLFDKIDRRRPNTETVGVRVDGSHDSFDFRGSAELTADFVPWADQESTNWALPWDRLSYIRADRMGPLLLHPKSHGDVVGARSIGARGEYAVHYLLVNGDRNVHIELCLDDADPRLVAQCEAWVGRLSPDARLYLSSLDGTDAATLRFSDGKLTGLEGGREHRSTNVGFGLSYALPIIVACLSAQPGDLLLIENPEAHLHPRGQSAMAELCIRAARAGAQIIVETHSDHVLNRLRLAIARKELKPANVASYFFDRGAKNLATAQRLDIDSQGRLEHWPVGFFDEYMNSVLELADH